jgi:hypothetical protein
MVSGVRSFLIVAVLTAVVAMGVPGPAPALAQGCGTYSGRGCASDARRVDLAKPSFSNPLHITNPLFPISDLHSAVFLGREEGRPFRSETTLLPRTGAVTWNGAQVPVLLSQYMAWVDGRLKEVALDRYAQADDGSVWYLGEDVIDYAGGHAVSTEGTWLAGREGPAAMIMPARPKVGDVYRPENVPGIVFEEVTVKATGRTVSGPHGPVAGAIVGQELHLDGTTENKTFAPGYGEFFTGSGQSVEAIAVAVPVDAQSGPVPAKLQTIDTAASGMLGSVEAEDWKGAAVTLRRMRSAWRSLLRAGQPRLIAAGIDKALGQLTAAVRGRKPHRALSAALDVQQLGLDLQLRHRPRGAVDRDRMELWCQRLRIDARARHTAAVNGDATTLDWIRERIADTLTPERRHQIDVLLRRVQATAQNRRTAAAADHAARLIGVLRQIPRL